MNKKDKILLKLFKNKLYKAKNRPKYKGGGTPKKFDKDVDEYYLLRMWHRQKGRCKYSDLIMDYKPLKDGNRGTKNPKIVSIDRIDCNKGYVKGNIVLVCWMSNFIKKNFNLSYIKKYFKKVIWANK